MTTRDLAVAKHEAAHVVVGVALGLRLRKAVINVNNKSLLGYAHFRVPKRMSMAWAITLAAGMAFERHGGDIDNAHGDEKLLREMGYNKYGIDALTKAADAILETRSMAHAEVTRALMYRDLTGSDIEMIARGEEPENVE